MNNKCQLFSDKDNSICHMWRSELNQQFAVFQLVIDLQHVLQDSSVINKLMCIVAVTQSIPYFWVHLV